MQKDHELIHSDRYPFDFSKEFKRGWKQYDTRQDAHYYGVWYNPESMQALEYCEGDVYLMTCETWDEFIQYLHSMDEFHGSAPPCAVGGDGLDVNLRLINPVRYYDPNARWDYSQPEPAHREPTPWSTIKRIFYGKEQS